MDKETELVCGSAAIKGFDGQFYNIPSLMASCRFLALEPGSNRAEANLTRIQKIINGNVKETGKNSISLSIDSDMLPDSTEKGQSRENDFLSTDLILSLSEALDHEKNNKNQTEVEQFIRKFEIVCSSLEETRPKKRGFYWDYYVPYFTEMKDKNLIETFGYIVFTSCNNLTVTKWLNSHKREVGKFNEWSNSFVWKTY